MVLIFSELSVERAVDLTDITCLIRPFSRHIYDPALFLHVSFTLLHTRQQITKEVILMAGSSTEVPGQHRQLKGSYLLTNGIWCWAWAALTGGFYWLKEHDIMAVCFSMSLWQSGWRCRERRHLVTQRCRALLNRWQETSEESGNGQQMEKRSCRRPEECSVYTLTHCQYPVPDHNTHALDDAVLEFLCCKNCSDKDLKLHLRFYILIKKEENRKEQVSSFRRAFKYALYPTSSCFFLKGIKCLIHPGSETDNNAVIAYWHSFRMRPNNDIQQQQ